MTTASSILDKEDIFNLIRQNTHAKNFIIAYSGGVDSHVLLHLMSQFPEATLKVVHINHGLQDQADLWQQHCREVCEALSLDFESEKVTINNIGKGIESAAREARYHILEQYIDGETCLLTAHNLDDQSETFLLRLMRGAGVKGLAAMSLKRKFSKGIQLRPLLFTSRKDIEAYANAHELEWVEDTSNKDTKFDRNYLRHEIMPRLTMRWSQAKRSIQSSVKHMQQTEILLMEYAAEDFRSIIASRRRTDPGGLTNVSGLPRHSAPHDDVIPRLDSGIQKNLILNCKKLSEFSDVRIFNIIRYWLTQLNLVMPSKKQLEHVLSDCINGSDAAEPCVRCGDYEFHRYRGGLYLVFLEEEVVFNLNNIDIPESFDRDKFSVRYRQGGEKIKLPGREHHSLLKKLFQEWGIPPWLRDKVPLVYYNDELVAIIGYAVAEHFNFIEADPRRSAIK